MPNDKEVLLAAFERFLTEAPEAGPEVDLAQLFAELAALRVEVRTETQRFDQTLEEYRRLLELTEQEQAGHAARLKAIERELLRPLLLDLVELRDRQALESRQYQRCAPTGWCVAYASANGSGFRRSWTG